MTQRFIEHSIKTVKERRDESKRVSAKLLAVPKIYIDKSPSQEYRITQKPILKMNLKKNYCLSISVIFCIVLSLTCLSGRDGNKALVEAGKSKKLLKAALIAALLMQNQQKYVLPLPFPMP